MKSLSMSEAIYRKHRGVRQYVKPGATKSKTTMENPNASPKPETPAELSCTDLLADVAFLVQRSSKAGSCRFSDERDTGMSSNSIVAIGYGITPLENQTLPSDWSDLNACEKMWLKLPAHRKTPDAITALERARVEVNRKYPKSANDQAEARRQGSGW